MAAKKTQEVAIVNEQELAELKDLYPVEQSSRPRIILPRIGFASQDVTEGKGKAMVVTTEAGTFFIERESDEVNAEGKKIWKKEEIGSAMEGQILFHRYQLSYYDEATEEYTSSPVYDDKDEILPLWCNKKEIAKGTPAELKALYKFVDKDGKEKSKLKDNRIVYILKGGELFQLNLHGSSMYSFMKYVRTVNPPSVVTSFQSEPQEKGTIAWNMMTFKPIRNITPVELTDTLIKIKEIKMAVAMEKGESRQSSIDNDQAEKDFAAA